MKPFKNITALFLLQLFSLSSYAAEAPIPITTTTSTTTIKIPTTTTTTQPFRPQLPIDGAPHEKIVVSGCTASTPGCVDKSVMDLGKISAPCFGDKSLILRNKADPFRYTKPAYLKHNDCQGSHPLSSLGSEFALVEKFIVGSEQRFIAALKAAPELVVDFNNNDIRDKLTKNGGKIPYTWLEAYVFGDLMNELANPKTRTPESRAALHWLAKGSQAINLRTWDNAQKMYYEWKKDPCSFKLPDDFPQSLKDDFDKKNKSRNLKVGCDFQNSIISTAQSTFKITQVAQGNPDVEEFVKWGGYLTTKDVLFDRQDSFNETALSLTAISVISATAVAAAGGIAAFIAAATITTTVTATIGGVTGAVTGLAAVSAVMPFSGGIVAASSAAGAAVSGAMMGVGVFLGPLVIVVAAIATITASIGITVEDSAFHSTMQNASPPWDTTFIMEKKLESMQTDVSGGKGGDLLFAFSDALSVNNSKKFLPFTIKIPPLHKASAAYAGNTLYKASGASNPLYNASATPAAWVLGTRKVGRGYEIFKRKGNSWEKVPGDATQITVDNAGNPWVLNSVGEIWHLQNNKWARIPGAGIDIGSGGGKTWVLGTKKVGGNYEIFERVGNTWKKFPGGAVRIDVDNKGNPWIVNSAGAIYHLQNRKWVKISGAGIDIGSGGGKTWVLGTRKVGGNYEIYERVNNTWKKFPGGAVRIDVGSDGNPWVVNSTGTIFKLENRKWVTQTGKAVDIGLQ